MPCYKIHINGAVYKTGFRYYLKAKAESLGISGMVFYKNDTTVGAIVSGSEEKIKTFLEFCKTGYPLVEITKTEVTTFDVVDEKPETLGMRND